MTDDPWDALYKEAIRLEGVAQLAAMAAKDRDHMTFTRRMVDLHNGAAQTNVLLAACLKPDLTPEKMIEQILLTYPRAWVSMWRIALDAMAFDARWIKWRREYQTVLSAMVADGRVLTRRPGDTWLYRLSKERRQQLTYPYLYRKETECAPSSS